MDTWKKAVIETIVENYQGYLSGMTDEQLVEILLSEGHILEV